MIFFHPKDWYLELLFAVGIVSFLLALFWNDNISFGKTSKYLSIRCYAYMYRLFHLTNAPCNQ
ncbi:MAG: hypothetical protein Q8R40_06995 [bacterium]|nr:hypothetical protein [bacterium]